MRDFKPQPRFKRERVKLENPPTGLVLTRGIGEAIIIGEDVLVTIVEVNGKRVRLCVTAPPEIAVDRTEVRESKRSNPR